MAAKMTGRDRYRQAMLKARLASERSAKAYDRGEVPFIEGWKTRQFLEAELERAYVAGFDAGRQSLSLKPEDGR